MKRALDIILSALALLVFLPFGIVFAIALRLTGEGEIFYLQPRVGKGRKTFGLIKFATMLKDSPNLGTGDITVKSDPRMMPLGPFLRKTKLNEVPQLLNIIKGDMSIVGPRPLTPKNFSYYPESSRKKIAQLTPGLTGIGSIVFRDEESLIAQSQKEYIDCYKEDISPYKGMLEEWYHDHMSFKTDILIIFLTSWVIISPNSYLYKRVFKDLPER